VRDIRRIELVNLKQKGRIYVIGVGCGDVSLLTNEAVSYMGRADAFVCMESYQRSLAGYIAGKPVLFDPFMQLGRFYRTKHPEVSEEEAEKAAKDIYTSNIEMLREALADGKIVALLEPGDPTLYGGWRNWLSPYFPKESIRVIAGMSSFNVANAMLGEYNITRGPVIITEPEDFKGNESLIQTAARTDAVIVIFIGLSRMKDLVPQFTKYFEPDTPVHLIFYAGIAGMEERIKTTLSEVSREIADNREGFLGLIYIGRKLK